MRIQGTVIPTFLGQELGFNNEYDLSIGTDSYDHLKNHRWLTL